MLGDSDARTFMGVPALSHAADLTADIAVFGAGCCTPYLSAAEYANANLGVSDESWGESVKALVVLGDGMAATEDALISHCRDHLASYKKPKSVEFLSELSKNATGKVLKRQLRDRYWQGHERRV
jgi:acyl-CoA synthetase (AMP-forming)/AMP-acid ligase II